MKIKLIVAIVAIAFTVGIAGWNRKNSDNIGLNQVMLENVEALTKNSDTTITDGAWVVTIYSTSHWSCKPKGGVCCPDVDC